MRIDLDAARAARREATGEAPTVLFDGREYQLSVELPYEVVEALVTLQGAEPGFTQARALADTVRSFLGGDQADDFMKSRPSIADLNAFVNSLGAAYGFNQAEEEEHEPGDGS